jgi:hypothetical protein
MVNKLLAAIITLGVAIIISLVISLVILSHDYNDLTISGDWTPPSTATVTPTRTAAPRPTEQVEIAVSPTGKAGLTTICVHTVSYWAKHPELWPELVNISGFEYSRK